MKRLVQVFIIISQLSVFQFLICLTLLTSDTTAQEDIRVLKDVTYKSGDLTEYEAERCKLDLYLPTKGRGFATIIWFHGGGIQTGDKAGNIAKAFGERFASLGIAVASVNYRLHPKVTFPAYIDDSAASFAFIYKTVAKHGGSPKRIFMSGHSAGGYLVAMVGADPQFLAKYDLNPSDIAGLMPVSGQMITHATVRKERGIAQTKPIIDYAAPSYHVNKTLPPFINFVGSKDLPARAEENGYFIAAMEAAGHKDVTYVEVEGRTHVTIASDTAKKDDVVVKSMRKFIERLKP